MEADDLDELLRRRALTEDAARHDAVARRHAAGGRTARENVTDLVAVADALLEPEPEPEIEPEPDPGPDVEGEGELDVDPEPDPPTGQLVFS